MAERTDDWPVLNDEFADRYCELQKEFAQLRDQQRGPVLPPFTDQKLLEELAELRQKYQQENQRATVAEQLVQDWREKYEAAAARVEELLARIRTLEIPMPVEQTSEVRTSHEVEDLRRQLIKVQDERRNWQTKFEECLDKLNGST